MDKIDYLPLGSVVYLRKGYKKVLIIARGVIVNYEDDQMIFDYGAVQYPEGLMGDEIAYFQHESIDKVVFKGFSDDDDEMTIKRINAFMEENQNLRRG